MKLPDTLEQIIDGYNTTDRNIHVQAASSATGRAYGGLLRAAKGRLVESIGKSLITLAWEKSGQDPQRLGLDGRRIRIPIKKDYLAKLNDPIVKDHIARHMVDYYYEYKPDILITVDGQAVAEMECKAYTENAMLKRILVDATLLKSRYPHMKFVLLQLESQLGGDFSELKEVTVGSPATHTLLSYFDIELHIITLLEGERKVDKPIHKPEFFKPLRRRSLEKAKAALSDMLEDYASM